MPLIRVFARVDSEFKIALPRGIRKALNVRPGDRLELTIVGMNRLQKLVVARERRRYAK